MHLSSGARDESYSSIIFRREREDPAIYRWATTDVWSRGGVERVIITWRVNHGKVHLWMRVKNRSKNMVMYDGGYGKL